MTSLLTASKGLPQLWVLRPRESRRLLLGTGLKGRKCQGEGRLGCRGRQDGRAGPLHEQASQAAAEDIRYPQEQVQGALRWQEGSLTEGRFQPTCPQALTGRGGNQASDRPPVFLSLVNTWKSLFHKKCDHPLVPVPASGAHLCQEVWSTAASCPVLMIAPRQHSPRAWEGG